MEATTVGTRTYPFLLHVDYEGTAIQVAHAEEVDIFISAQLLRSLGGVHALRRRRHERLDMIGKQRLKGPCELDVVYHPILSKGRTLSARTRNIPKSSNMAH